MNKTKHYLTNQHTPVGQLRREQHIAKQTAVRERKRIRVQRAAICAALAEAKRLKKSKKKGCANIEQNMLTLGYVFYPKCGQTIERMWQEVSA